jgi:hypothetical protein
VGGSISVALARSAWQGRWRTRCCFAAYNLALVAGFALAMSIGHNQLDTTTGGVTTREGMNTYWSSAFPPGNFLAALAWFALLTTGQMAAYPLGAADGGSTLTVLCCIAGLLWWARRKQWTWVALFGMPVVLNLVAALLHRYPYAGAARLSQHLAPGICIFAGLGVAAVLQRANWPAARRVRWTVALTVLFALIGLGGMVRDVMHPYRDLGCAWMRCTMKAMRDQVPDTDPVVICDPPQSMEAVFTWYWLNEGQRVSWDYQVPAEARSAERIWGFHSGPGADVACQRLTNELRRRDPAWLLVKRFPYVEQLNGAAGPESCELFFCARVSGGPGKTFTNRD